MTRGLSADDRAELYELYSRGTRLITMGDIDGWLDCFTSDAVFFLPGIEDFGVADMTMTGHAELRQFITDVIDGKYDPTMGLEPGTKKRYLVGNIMLDGDGDNGASGSAYFFLILPSKGDTPPKMLGSGVYDDSFVKTPAGWKIRNRTLTADV